MKEPDTYPGWPPRAPEQAPGGRRWPVRLLWIGAVWWATFVPFGLVIAWADVSIQKPPDPDLLLQVQALGLIWVLGMIGWIVALRRIGRRNKQLRDTGAITQEDFRAILLSPTPAWGAGSRAAAVGWGPTSQAAPGMLCGMCGKPLSPVWKGRCEHCGALYAEHPPVPRASN